MIKTATGDDPIDSHRPNRMSWSLRCAIWGGAVWLSLMICLLTGLIGDWGLWYSTSMAYRRQTNAFLSGNVALSQSPAEIDFDMAWSQDGVQQVWGLGVPLWRTPFELLAKIFGYHAFPDRIALLLAISIAAFVTLTSMTAPSSVTTVAEWKRHISAFPIRLLAPLLIIAFPPIINLCRGKFNVYEEAAVYEYYYCVTLFGMLRTFAHCSTPGRYLLVCALAGFAGFIRPTALAYGLPTVLIASVLACRQPWSWSRRLLGPFVFCLGLGLLFISNHQRFGSAAEFGHRLNITGNSLIYTSRFETPFERVPLFAAIRELVGAIFFVRSFNGFEDPYQAQVVLWQADIARSRIFYTSTFDLSFACLVLGSWAWNTRMIVKKGLHRSATDEPELTIAVAWSIVSFAMLFAFYLYFHAITSRYMLDFAPSMSIALSEFVLALSIRGTRACPRTKVWSVLFVSVVSLWWAAEIVTSRNLFPSSPLFRLPRLLDKIDTLPPQAVEFPEVYSADKDPEDQTNIPRNGYGWDHPSGQTSPTVVLFVGQLEGLTLEVENSDLGSENSNYDVIRARVGLEWLKVRAIKTTDRRATITFWPPSEANRAGIKTVFISFAPPSRFCDPVSPFRLLRVHWGSRL
jgi:hypothetical protein